MLCRFRVPRVSRVSRKSGVLRLMTLARRGLGQSQQGQAVPRAACGGNRGGSLTRASGPGGGAFQARQALPAPAHVAQFFGLEHAHHAVLAVKSALADDLAAPHAGHGLAQRLPVGADIRFRQVAEDIQLRPQFAQQAAVTLLHLARAGAHAQNFTHHLRQGNQGLGLGLQGQLGRSFAVGQFQHAVQHAHGQGLAADRADIVQGQGIARFQHHVAGPVPVQMVFAFFGIEFHGAQKTAVQVFLGFAPGRRAQGREHARVRGRPGKKIGLATQVGSGMGVGIGNQGIAVQPADQAVHGRVRGEAGFQGENMLGKVGEAVLQTIKAGFGAEQGEPGRPDMGGHQHALRHGFEHDFQQVA